MIEFTSGDLLQADTEALVNTVNCVGIMGRGIALQFKRAFPENFTEYEAACKRHEVVPGKMLVHRTWRITNPRYVINFPTKRHWRSDSRIEDIALGLQDLQNQIAELGIRSIAIPALGAGLGGLSWGAVRPLIETAFFNHRETRVMVFEPCGSPLADTMAKSH